ncbi:hypothetical protein BC629DRAFT_1595409 [Irpex lacteus]|nr:hypothetical protein BC629DRAFT_1595409 [Irpex lacteus]
MSYGNQSTNWNNDPNNFDNNQSSTGADRAFGDGPTDNFAPTTLQRDDTFGGNTSDINTYGAGGGGPGGRERGAYAGNTSDVNTVGAGGDFTGRDTGRLGDQDWDNTNTNQQAYQGNTSDYKPLEVSTAEKLTGKLTGNPNLAERGQERKEGDFERNY